MKVQTFAKPRECSPTSPIERLPFVDHDFKLVGEKTADRASLLGGQNSRLAQQVSFKL